MIIKKRNCSIFVPSINTNSCYNEHKPIQNTLVRVGAIQLFGAGIDRPPTPRAICFMGISKEEKRLYDAISSVYKGVIIQSHRPKQLKNIRTGNNLEIDIYIPEAAAGFEYQGAVHFQDILRFKNDSDKSRLHDYEKYGILQRDRKKRLTIVEVFAEDLKGDIISNVIKRIISTQEYYFDNRYFNKCYQLEILLCCLTGTKRKVIKNTEKWFQLCQNAFVGPKDIAAKVKAVKSVKKFLKQINTTLYPERSLFSISSINRLHKRKTHKPAEENKPQVRHTISGGDYHALNVIITTPNLSPSTFGKLIFSPKDYLTFGLGERGWLAARKKARQLEAKGYVIIDPPNGDWLEVTEVGLQAMQKYRDYNSKAA